MKEHRKPRDNDTQAEKAQNMQLNSQETNTRQQNKLTDRTNTQAQTIPETVQLIPWPSRCQFPLPSDTKGNTKDYENNIRGVDTGVVCDTGTVMSGCSIIVKPISTFVRPSKDIKGLLTVGMTWIFPILTFVTARTQILTFFLSLHCLHRLCIRDQ